MPHSVTWFDRLRIERVVWTLDQQLYDLPRRSRIAKRRELRTNLLSAAQDLGTSAALRRLGGTKRLAMDYLDAELGEGPRHSWVAAAYFAALVPLALMSLLTEAALAYQHGLTAADPHVSGTFTWNGVSFLQSSVTYTAHLGQVSQTGGAWTPLTYVLWAAGTILCGRLWRLIPVRKRNSPAVGGPRVVEH